MLASTLGMTKYEKQLQTGTKEYEEAMKPSASNPARDTRHDDEESAERVEEDEAKRDVDVPRNYDDQR